MEIEYKKTNKVTFIHLHPTDYFLCEGDLYMKLHEFEDEDNAICISSNSHHTAKIEATAPVILKKFKLVEI